MLTFAAVVFWTCLGLIAYVYAGYPILLFLLGSLRRAQTSHSSPPASRASR